MKAANILIVTRVAAHWIFDILVAGIEYFRIVQDQGQIRIDHNNYSHVQYAWS